MHWNVIAEIAAGLSVGFAFIMYIHRARGNHKWAHIGFTKALQYQAENDLTRLGGWAKGWERSLKQKRLARKQKRLDRLRERLENKIEELAWLEEVMTALNPDATVEQLIYFMNKLGARHWERLYAQLVLDPKADLGLNIWLRRHTNRDVVKDCWNFAPQFADLPTVARDLNHRLTSQKILWKQLHDSLRRDCMQHQQVIEEFEALLGIKKTDSEASPPDKRARLKGLRVRVAEMKLEEERLEQDILSEENRGAPGPHRRKAGVSTDTD